MAIGIFDLVCTRSDRILLARCKSAWKDSHRLVDGEHYYTVNFQDDPAAAMQARNERKAFLVVVVEATPETRRADRHDYSHPVNILRVEPTGKGGTLKNPERADAVEVKALGQLSREDFDD